MHTVNSVIKRLTVEVFCKKTRGCNMNELVHYYEDLAYSIVIVTFVTMYNFVTMSSKNPNSVLCV